MENLTQPEVLLNLTVGTSQGRKKIYNWHPGPISALEALREFCEDNRDAHIFFKTLSTDPDNKTIQIENEIQGILRSTIGSGKVQNAKITITLLGSTIPTTRDTFFFHEIYYFQLLDS